MTAGGAATARSSHHRPGVVGSPARSSRSGFGMLTAGIDVDAEANVGKVDNTVNRTDEVDAFMEKLDHPFKAEVELLREGIKSVNTKIVEQVKWKAPSFAYQGEYLVTFNLWSKDRVHLVFHNPQVVNIESELLEGDYADGRRMAYFYDMKDAKAKKAELKRIVKQLIKSIEK
ncbi:DUF1801 domain-containing protein [Micromonospora lutea]|nr:DUF1801 domain-containing protein [Micromonospora lutea]